ncbi:MAG: hypothetical protein ACE1Y2_02425 [Stenotrophomonas maltophilia]
MKAEAAIAKPAGDVWDALTDWSRAHEWMGVEWIKADGETIAGTKLAFYARGKERLSEISECQPGRRVVLRSVHGGVSADYAYTLARISHLAKTNDAVSPQYLYCWGRFMNRLAVFQI